MNREADPDPYQQGRLLYAHGRLAEAERLLRLAVELAPGDPQRGHALALCLMAQGKWRDAAPLREARHQLPQFDNIKRRLPFPEWSGQDLAGKHLLIWVEQGLGDQIQMARFGPWLQARGAQVTLLCRPELVRLFEGLATAVLPASGRIEFEDPDYWALPTDLPFLAGLTPFGVPNAPYLKATPRQTGERIGLMWRGNPQHQNDLARSLPSRPDLPGLVLEPEVTGARDLRDTADIIAGLDLVVTVDTAVAHLAGALGKPVWILLPYFNPDPRWFRGTATSPWYPSARLFWQGEDQSWAPS